MASEKPATAEDKPPTAGAPATTSTRCIVKNIPKHCDEKRLRKHFDSHGRDLEVTDVKVMRTRDGKARQFGFVGFRTAEAAARAMEQFDRTYIDTSRISVESARAFGDSDLNRPWSKHSKGSSAYMREHPEEAPAKAASGKAAASKDGAKKKKKPEHESAVTKAAADDPKFAEFLQLVDKKKKLKAWDNDMPLAEAAGKRGAPSGPSAQPREESRGRAAKRAKLAAENGARATGGADDSDDDDDEDDEDDYEELPSQRQAGGAEEDESEAEAEEEEEEEEEEKQEEEDE